jgi:DNA-binding NtrC family response regulator
MKNILIVDDTFENLYLLRVILQKEGFNVIEAENGEQGLKMLHQNKINMIISDILMPVMDGYMFCQSCKSDKKFKDIPFVFFSSTYTDKLDEDFALKLGGAKFLRRPMEQDKLILEIQKIFSMDNAQVSQLKNTAVSEKEVLRLYSERLISKLEIKNIELEKEILERNKTEEKLVSANEKLSKANLELVHLRKQLEQENVYLRNELDLVFNYEEMVYGSAAFSSVLSEVEKVAPTEATVLLQGESGTGKELIARAVHSASFRNNKPLIKVNCSAIPRELLESELFGHKKGSFTGAFNDKIGKFELANEGTLFLDEIGELPIDMQPKILRFLQEGEIEVVGGTGIKKLNVRVIAATNRELKKEIEKNRFREDLYFRLNVFPIIIPPLRDRPEDIPLLVEHFVDKFNKAYVKNIKFISDETMDKLRVYRWPGNIRELENLIERATILTNSEILNIPGFESTSQSSKQQIDYKNTDLTLEKAQRNHIKSVLEQCSWKISGSKGAAEVLNVKPSTLRDKMTKLGIKKPRKT